MLTRQLILSFSHTRWNDKWSEKQSILTHFARLGNVTVMVEPLHHWRALLRGSDLNNFYLSPGLNDVHLYVIPVGAVTCTCWMTWKRTNWAADTLAA